MAKRILLLAISMGSSTARAQGKLDHLLCYQARDDLKIKFPVDAIAELQPDFTRKQCRLVQPIEFCVPATKRVTPEPKPQPGQPLRDDYICYTVQCPKLAPPTPRAVTDQFGTRKQAWGQPTRFCVPARKESSPPPSCQPGPGGACFGTCPNSGQQCITVPGATPSCRCLTPCTRNPAGACVDTGQCSPQQKCQSFQQGCFCL
jgi:hypothetical protein